MQDLLKKMSMERMGKPLDVLLQRDREFMESRERYHKFLKSLKKELKDSQGEVKLVMRLDDAVGEYSGHYGEVAYVLGFHDGLEIGIKHGYQYGEKCDMGKSEIDERAGIPSAE